MPPAFRPALAVSLVAASFHPAYADTVDLTTPVPGVVERVHVEPGAMVKRGALLVTLDTTRFEAGLDIARAEATRSELELADAARELARAEELYARTVSSTTELDAARLRHARAAATHTTNQARLRIAQKTLDDASLKAPFAGVVKSVAAPGTVTTDCSLKTLVQLAR